MDFIDEPATWKQLRDLNRCGYQPDRRLTKDEASRLISKFRGEPAAERAAEKAQARPTPNARQVFLSVATGGEGHNGGTSEQYVPSKDERQEFWLSTCRGTTRIPCATRQVLELYRKHGCLFCEPTPKQVQDILDALDCAMPRWEKEHPELFYQALKLNFPELVRHH